MSVDQLPAPARRGPFAPELLPVLLCLLAWLGALKAMGLPTSSPVGLWSGVATLVLALVYSIFTLVRWVRQREGVIGWITALIRAHLEKPDIPDVLPGRPAHEYLSVTAPAQAFPLEQVSAPWDAVISLPQVSEEAAERLRTSRRPVQGQAASPPPSRPALRPALLTAALLFVVLVGGAGLSVPTTAAFVNRSSGEALAVDVPGEAPPTWRDAALWVTATDADQPPLVGPGGWILVPSRSGMISSFRGDTGQAVWQTALPKNLARNASPRLTTLDGRTVAAVRTDAGLTWWDMEKGSRGQTALPREASVTFTGRSPLITAGSRAYLISRGKPVIISIPAGLTPLAAEDGAIIAADAHGSWRRVTASGAGPALKVLSPLQGGGTGRIVMAGRGVVVSRWTSGDTVRVIVQDAVSGQLRQEITPGAGVRTDGSAVVAADGSGLALKSLLIDLKRNRSLGAPGASLAVVSDGNAFGVSGSGRGLALTKNGAAEYDRSRTNTPWGVVEGKAIITVTQPDGRRLYALAPDLAQGNDGK